MFQRYRLCLHYVLASQLPSDQLYNDAPFSARSSPSFLCSEKNSEAFGTLNSLSSPYLFITGDWSVSLNDFLILALSQC